jgi:transaldolase
MKFFLDTANVDEIKEAVKYGVVNGVTTNPTLIAKEVERTGAEFKAILKEICQIVQGPVNGEVVSLDAEGMVTEGKELAKLDDYIVIKIPMTKEGLKAVKTLSAENIPTNVTLIFSPTQALLSAKAGATYISPFVGRLDDISHPGMELIDEILTIYQNYGFETEIIVASIRSPNHVVEAAITGAHIATIPFKVIEQMMKHPLTDIGIQKFLEDWKKVGGKK